MAGTMEHVLEQSLESFFWNSSDWLVAGTMEHVLDQSLESFFWNSSDGWRLEQWNMF